MTEEEQKEGVGQLFMKVIISGHYSVVKGERELSCIQGLRMIWPWVGHFTSTTNPIPTLPHSHTLSASGQEKTLRCFF